MIAYRWMMMFCGHVSAFGSTLVLEKGGSGIADGSFVELWLIYQVWCMMNISFKGLFFPYTSPKAYFTAFSFSRIIMKGESIVLFPFL